MRTRANNHSRNDIKSAGGRGLLGLLDGEFSGLESMEEYTKSERPIIDSEPFECPKKP